MNELFGSISNMSVLQNYLLGLFAVSCFLSFLFLCLYCMLRYTYEYSRIAKRFEPIAKKEIVEMLFSWMI